MHIYIVEALLCMCAASGNPRRVQRRRKAGGRAVGVPPTDSANKSHPRLHNRFAMLSKLTARSAIPPFELRFNPSTSINEAAYSPDSHNPMLGQAMVSGLFSAWSGLVGSARFCSGYVERAQQASQRPRAVNLCMC